MVNSPLLELLGIDPAIIFGVLFLLVLILLILLIVTMTKLGRTNRRLDGFMRGKDAESLEETMLDIISEIERLKSSDMQKRRDIKRINDNLMITYQKQGIIKYDAFNEMGGKLSFAMALLDKNNNGFTAEKAAIHTSRRLSRVNPTFYWVRKSGRRWKKPLMRKI